MVERCAEDSIDLHIRQTSTIRVDIGGGLAFTNHDGTTHFCRRHAATSQHNDDVHFPGCQAELRHNSFSSITDVG